MIRCVAILTTVLLCGCFVFFDSDYPIADVPDVGEPDQGQPDLRSIGSACDDDSQCFQGHCQNEVCCATGSDCCTEDSDCGPYACNTDLAECYANCTGDDGDDHTRCPPDYHCFGGQCLNDVPSGTCEDDDWCDSGVCTGGSCCVYAGLCCEGDEQCGQLFRECTEADRTCAFATWEIPATGQTRCYGVSTDTDYDCAELEDLAGQDGHRADFPERVYTVDEEAGTVLDQATELTWTRDVSERSSFALADLYCRNLGRELPDLFELMTIVDYGSTLGVMLDEVFPPPPLASGDGEYITRFWTSTPVSGASGSSPNPDPPLYWVVEFQNGTVQQANEDQNNARARCVQ